MGERRRDPGEKCSRRAETGMWITLPRRKESKTLGRWVEICGGRTIRNIRSYWFLFLSETREKVIK